ncbi:MAG: 50S ribosomal protein L11 methyltransferase, partial [Proteobacteria bacterium]|nr:50S ribosomal protein L11 methyltransferase [Pseudomonadota bacterium]
IDIDPQALIATHDNAIVNQVSDKIDTYLPDDYIKKHSETQYETVVANILSGPLSELAPTLAQHTKLDGHIVLSGILREQADSVLKSYGEYFEMDEPVFEEDWVLLHGIRT